MLPLEVGVIVVVVDEDRGVDDDVPLLEDPVVLVWLKEVTFLSETNPLTADLVLEFHSPV